MRTLTFLLCGVALAACATAHPATESHTSTSEMSTSVARPASLTGSGDPQVQQLIGQMEDQWAQAGLKYDTVTVGRMIAPEYFAVNNDHIGDRAETLRAFSRSDSSFTPLSNSDSARTVRVYGDAAVVTAIGDVSFRNNKTGEAIHNLGRYTEVWVKRDGQWQVVAGAYQDAELPKAVLTQQLMQAEESYTTMVNHRDSAAFNSLVQDSVIFASGTDTMFTKPQLWSAIRQSDFRQTHHVDRTFIRGEVAIVNGTIDRTLKDGSAAHLRYADTWVHRGGRWRLISRQLAGPASRPTR